MRREALSKKRYATPEMVVYGSVPFITRESTTGDQLDAPIQGGQTFEDATFS